MDVREKKSNEKRLIDADALLDKFLRSYTEQEKVGNFQFVACEIKQDFADMVCDTPTIDALPVVRCRECKYWQDNNGGYPHECRWGNGETPDPDDFCSYGERKEGAD